MPTPIGYFISPFAETGEAAPIPITTQIDGSISYPQGYGPDYELDLLTNPEAQPIGRLTMNQLFLDITSQLQQYSQYGTPPFITTLQNDGVPFPYPKFARVYYSDVVYENQVIGNIVLPGSDATWLAISGDATGVLPGTVIDFAGPVVPVGWLGCDGSAVLRSTYATLLSAITQVQTGTTTNTLNTVSGLTDTSQMYVGMDVESINFSPGTTIASIVDANNITVIPVAIASGAVDIQFFNWDNGDGSTTFNVPDLRRSTTIGQGSAPSAVIGDAVGETGGVESYTLSANNLPAHTHPQQAQTVLFTGSSTTFVAGGPATTSTGGTTGNNTTTGTAISLMQPSAVMFKIIKT